MIVAAYSLWHLLWRGHRAEVAHDGVGLFCLVCEFGPPFRVGAV